MSYILEALRRAERERDTGKAPTVDALHRPPVSAPERMPVHIWLLAGATALIAVIALAVLLWPRPAPPAAKMSNVPAPAAQMPPQTPVQAPPRAVPDVALSTDSDAERSAAIEDRDEIASLDDVTEGDDEGRAAAELQPQDVGPSTAALAPGTTLVTPRRGATTATDSMPAPEPETSNAQPPAAAQPQIAPAAADGPKPTVMVPRGVTVLREMPAAYRAQFPATTLDVHVYDPDPARRWIMVGGQRYREGQSLPSGPSIVGITETGVIFDYQGAQVLLPVQ